MNIKNLVTFILFFLTSAPTEAQKKTPGVRNGHCMAYDTSMRSIIFFGGADEKEVKNDTWIYKDEKWEQITTAGPLGRTFANMIYDPSRKTVILFGGNKVLFGDSTSGNTTLNDTWEFKNNSWQHVNTTTSPPARAEAGMAFNEINNTILLFGGYTLSNDGTRTLKRLNDTWEFNGSDWKLLSLQGPEPRSGCAMAFDKNLNRCVLFGGNIRSSKNDPMWSWDGAKWDQVKTEAETVYNTSMIFSDDKKMLIRYGGYNGKTRVDTTWYYSRTNDWQILKTSVNPLPRNHACMVYDTGDSSTFLYGGHDGDYVFGDMWKLKNDKWTQIFKTTSRRRIENNH